MEKLPKYMRSNIFMYCDVNSAQNLRSTCKIMKNSLDKVDLSVLDKREVKFEPKIMKNNSRGLTYLIYRDVNGKGCISCMLDKRICGVSIHPIFDVTLCKRCKMSTYMFKMGGFKSLCKKHHISVDDARSSKRIRVTGRIVERVLESDIRNESDRIVGIFEKERRDALRETRSLIIYQNRISAVTRRENELRKRFENYVKDFTRFEISERYRDFELILSLCPKVCRGILHDIFDHRVTTKQHMCCVISGMTRISKMFTILDYYKFLITCPNGQRFQLTEELTEYISLNQLYKRGNYEVLISQYFRAIRSFRSKGEERSLRYNRDPENSTAYDRFEVSEYACEQDEVDFNEQVFEDFIESNVGNPYIIARSIRKMDFLLENGYGDIFLATNSTWVSRVHVLNHTMGYCPMI